MISAAEAKSRVNQMFVLGNYEDFSVNSIIELLEVADDLYFNDEQPIIDDDQYDALKQYAQRTSPTHVYFTGIGSQVRGGKVTLPHKMGSLNQVYQGDYQKWVAKHSINDEQVVITDKLDGASGLLVYNQQGSLQIAYSRGDGFEGADITRHVSKIHNVPKQINNTTGSSVAIRVENIISPTQFKRINTGKFSRGGRIYKNPRNMVSGLMNSSENHSEVYTAIDTVAYEIVGSNLNKVEQLNQLSKWGFKVVRYTTHRAGSMNDDTLTKLLNERRSSSEYELDGIVIDVASAAVRQRLATDELNPEYAVKFKVADASNLATATVKHVEWNVSKDGYLKPRVCIEPVDLVGVTIQHATGFNAKFIKDNQIGPGAKIQITRSGDVIPFILNIVEPAPKGADMPQEDAVWTETGVDLVLADIQSNTTVMFERLNDFFASIDVPHLGDGNLQKMFEMGFDTPEKIIPLTQEDIGSLVNSLAIGRKIFKGLREKLTNVPMYKLMGAHASFGRGVGERKMKKLYEAFEGDMTKCQDLDAIVAVEGFDVKTATKIVKGYPEFQQFFATIEQYVTLAPYVAKKTGHLSGQSFVFTGFRSAQLEQAITDAGGTMSSGVSGKTTYLVTAEPDSTSTKAQKAKALGVKVISQQQLKEML